MRHSSCSTATNYALCWIYHSSMATTLYHAAMAAGRSARMESRAAWKTCSLIALAAVCIVAGLMGRSYGPDPGTQQPAEPPRYSREIDFSLACRASGQSQRHRSQALLALRASPVLPQHVLTCENAVYVRASFEQCAWVGRVLLSSPCAA